jgi:hypothetical protein
VTLVEAVTGKLLQQIENAFAFSGSIGARAAPMKLARSSPSSHGPSAHRPAQQISLA